MIWHLISGKHFILSALISDLRRFVTGITISPYAYTLYFQIDELSVPIMSVKSSDIAPMLKYYKTLIKNYNWKLENKM